MVIIISYNKQTWNEYDDSQTSAENLAKGGIISADRLNHMETGISNNDTNKVTDNKDDTIEVNGNSITPADDSKVVHTANTSNWQKYPITDVTGSLTTYIGSNYPYTSIKQLLDTSINGFYTTYIAEGTPDTPDSSTPLRGIIQLENNFVWGILIGEAPKISYYVNGTYGGNTSDLNWIKLANDSAVVHSTDMRKPASDVAGIEEVNAKQDKIAYTPADDSKVAHLSGANNFDTVPTVNNNPLLLASSLPSDLARTGSDQEFTGKNTFDTAPIDKTTGNPYITDIDLNNGLNTKVTDNKNGSITVNGATFIPADDSKAVHNSGNEEIGGQKKFDTAPIDKTSGQPYITRSDVPEGNIQVVTQADYDALTDKTGLYVIQG